MSRSDDKRIAEEKINFDGERFTASVILKNDVYQTVLI